MSMTIKINNNYSKNCNISQTTETKTTVMLQDDGSTVNLGDDIVIDPDATFLEFLSEN